MATAETAHTADQTERHGRRRPFSSWMRKLASLKPGSFTAPESNQISFPKRSTYQTKSNSKKPAISKNNPYTETINVNTNPATLSNNVSCSTVPTVSLCTSSLDPRDSPRSSEDGLPPTIENKSTTVTSTGRANSVVAPSHATSSAQGTNCTTGFGPLGNDSTFSSPAPSVRSLTTTLTTLHSAAPAASFTNNMNTNTTTIHFSHQFPTSSPLNAIPAHLAPHGGVGGNPSTYNTATANNLLTDNASILTLASSSKRRRKRSIDTDASVRALAPSSIFGGSRESLPLSVLSTNIDPISHQPRPSIGGLNERGSIYSISGATPNLPSERNSYYASKQPIAADAGSIKGSPLGHSRNESFNGGGTGMLQGNPLASSRDTALLCPRKVSYSETVLHEDSEASENKEISGKTL